MTRPREAWYLRTSVLVLAFLAVGPFAIPLVWMNPRFTATKKAVVTGVMIAITALLVWLCAYSLGQIRSYYDLMTEPWPGASETPVNAADRLSAYGCVRIMVPRPA
jgi:hypothetical protein